MAEKRVIEEIEATIKDREKTDRRMSFSRSLLTSLIISGVVYVFSYIYFGVLYGTYEDFKIRLPDISLVSLAVYLGLIVFPLAEREKHFERERELLNTLILWFEGKIDESKLSNMKNELTNRENEEKVRHLESLKELTAIPILGSLIGVYITFFLPKDFYRHDKREPQMLRYLHDAMESVGTSFHIPTKLPSQEIPERDFKKYMLKYMSKAASIVGLIVGSLAAVLLIKGVDISTVEIIIVVGGIALILYVLYLIVAIGLTYWFYIAFKDPNNHFEYQKKWEDSLLDAIKAPMNAALILPKRSIALAGRNVFGKGDFQSDLSKEDLDYITTNERGRYHFMIIKEDGLYYIKDDHSTNGTKLNDVEIKGVGQKELKNGDKITLAGINNFTITFKIK